MEQTDRVAIKHARNGREHRLPELPHFSVDGNSAEKIQFTSLSGVILMAAPVNRFVTSLPQTEAHWRPDMNVQCDDCSR